MKSVHKTLWNEHEERRGKKFSLELKKLKQRKEWNEEKEKPKKTFLMNKGEFCLRQNNFNLGFHCFLI